MSQTEDVAELLAELGHGTYSAEDESSIFLGELPDQPTAAVAVAPYPGVAGNARIGYDRRRYQITVRRADYRTAETAADAIYADLAGLRHRPLGGAWLALVAPVQSGPVWMPPETDANPRFVINVELHLHQPTVHRT